jgi:drug/metabolite transporter (DMT)-like permease
LVIVAILSGAIAPALIFQALALTSANTVILVGRLEPPLTLALSIWLLHETVNGWQIGGAIAALTGVALAIGLQPMTGTFIPMLELSLGEWLVIGSTIVLAVSTVIGKKRLARVPLGIYSTMRTALGTVIFFSVASVLYGSDHFMDAFSPFLWQWMLIYGAIIVALGQAFWIKGSRASSVSEASVMASFTPLVGIVAAYLVLGEIPTTAQYVGSSLILVGMGLNQVGLRTRARLAPAPPETPSTASGQAISSVMGFRGM